MDGRMDGRRVEGRKGRGGGGVDLENKKGILMWGIFFGGRGFLNNRGFVFEKLLRVCVVLRVTCVLCLRCLLLALLETLP